MEAEPAHAIVSVLILTGMEFQSRETVRSTLRPSDGGGGAFDVVLFPAELKQLTLTLTLTTKWV